MKDAMDRNLSAAPCLHDRPPHPNPPTDDSRDLVPLMIPKHAAAGAALAVEVRTLRERLVVLRARAAALDQKVAAQAEDLEKYRHALGAAAEALRQQQNLAASYPLHAGAVLAERGRWLAAEYRARGLRGRLKLLPRLAEFLDAHARLAAAAQPPADWPAVLAELEAARAGGWRRLVFGPAAWRRSLRLLARRLRLAG